MRITDYPVDNLPYSKLFQTYLNDFAKLDEFFEVNPFDPGAVAEWAESFTFKGDRSRAVQVLRAYNEQFSPEPHPAVLENLERLELPGALAIVTGQQPGVYGGPLFTVLKTLTVLYLSGQLEKTLDRPVVPVFWIGDEDHDFEEVRTLGVPGRDELHTVSLGPLAEHSPPVSELRFDGSIGRFRGAVKEVLYETDFSEEFWELIDQCYKEESRMDIAFGSLIQRIFGERGLVLAGSNFPGVKQLTADCLKRAISEASGMREAIEGQTGKVKKEFHQQVTIYDSNLFYLNDEGREKIMHDHENGTWHTAHGRRWTDDELAVEIEENPVRFSPNVFLRPVLQDRLLPTLGYVGGPGEIGYYAQMKEFFHMFDMKMPVIFPRMTASMIEPAIDRILEELPFEFHEYAKRIEDLESEYVERSGQMDIESIFTEWKSESGELSERFKKKISEIDPTLENAAGKAEAVFAGELDKLKGKVYRSVKQQEQTQIDRIHKIKSQLFPDHGLQEREVAWIYFMNKYGTGIWLDLLDVLPEDFNADNHKLVYL